jgi:hypothetical protein
MNNLARLALFPILVCAVPAFAEDAFKPQCKLPYAAIAKKNAIDVTCPPEGRPSSSAHASEYRAKNNLCAAGPAVVVTLADIIAMQKAAEDAGIPIGDRNTPVPDRAKLKDIFTTHSGKKIGEGDLVRVVVYVTGAAPTGAKHADGTAGEGVNCKQPGAKLNDIHIDVGAKPNSKPCAGIVAEMIPHFRPIQWTPENLRKVGSRPVRMAGQLFLDSRHDVSTCSKPSPGDPPRISLWEIHPIYALDVCKVTSLSKCDANNDAMWVSFHQWLSSKPAKGAKLVAKKATRQHMQHE